MTDSIKPPGGPPSAPPPPTVGGPGEGRFRGTLEATGSPEATASKAASSGELGAVTAGLRDGSLTPEAAISRLIEQHLSTGPARALTPAARAELERLLRARFEDDPALAALTAELGRAR